LYLHNFEIVMQSQVEYACSVDRVM